MSDNRDAFDKRKFVRTETSLRGTLTLEGKSVDCEIVDISAGGGKLRSDEPLDRGRAVTLSIAEFGDFTGDIAWRSSNMMGIRFRGDPELIAETLTAIVVYAK